MKYFSLWVPVRQKRNWYKDQVREVGEIGRLYVLEKLGLWNGTIV